MAKRPKKPKKGEQATPGWIGLWVKALAALGLFQVYNIITRYQEIADLSKSVQVIADWWHFISARFFSLLHIHLSMLQRDTLVVMLCLISAANLAYYRDRRAFLPKLLVREAISGEGPNSEAWKKYVYEDSPIQVAISAVMIAIFCFALTIVTATPPFRLLVFMAIPWIAMLFLILMRLWEGSGRVREIVSIVLKILAAPMTLLGMIAGASFYYRSQIAKSLRWLIVFMLADMTARYLIDPLIHRWPEIPRPPS